MHPNTAVTLVTVHCYKFHPTLSSLRYINRARVVFPKRW